MCDCSSQVGQAYSQQMAGCTQSNSGACGGLFDFCVAQTLRSTWAAYPKKQFPSKGCTLNNLHTCFECKRPNLAKDEFARAVADLYRP
jgi:hypothetical protein